MFTPTPTLLCDFYKLGHRKQYPTNTEMVYSTWTPRSNRYFPHANKVVAFGFQGFIKAYMIDVFNEYFFKVSKKEIISEYARVVKHCLGDQNPDTSHIEYLHNLGYLPLHIKAVPEGTRVPIRTPMLTIHNTTKELFWLTNYFETLMSTELWQPSTSATIAYTYRKILDEYAKVTSDDLDFVQFQGHDFSMRGMGGLESGMLSGAGHLLSFVGTDTIPAILYLEKYYNANIEKELVGCSVPATEHSVMCAGGADNEYDTYDRIITDIYPNGIVSIVSDTWDLWKCIAEIISPLKPKIEKRDGKVVIRPDSGDPTKILCGDKDSKVPIVRDGLIEALWSIFGGSINSKGYKVLNPKIGSIYGDSITIDRCLDICEGLKQRAFASTNTVLGIGSFTYQYNTRDTFGFALKSTACSIDGKELMIFKDPATDDGTKKSQKGAVLVKPDGSYIDELSVDHNEPDVLRTIFKDGELTIDDSLSTIRQRLSES